MAKRLSTISVKMRLELAKAKAERIINEELRLLGWPEGQLALRRKRKGVSGVHSHIWFIVAAPAQTIWRRNAEEVNP